MPGVEHCLPYPFLSQLFCNHTPFSTPLGNVSGARGILKTFDSKVPGHALVKLRRIGLEVRHRNLQLAEALLDESVADAKTQEAKGFYSWRYARFAAKVLGDVDKASKVMVSAISQDKVGGKFVRVSTRR